KYIPQAGRFAGLCFDQAFVETLHAVLTGVSHAMPVALEGETAASKTTAVLYLAHVLGQPVVRLNLNGQTDPGELVGRYIPSDQGWGFHEGSLPQAMRHGYWLLLDEMNLAEPQVLERLNCALENPPTLVLSEGTGTVFGPGGEVGVSENFRLLATLNPAEYSGRSVLSPAFRNRWLIWHQARAADEASIVATLRTLVLGEQPVVHWHGRSFRADATAPLFPQLAAMPDLDAVLTRFAMFHSTVAKAAHTPGKTPGLARQSRERHTFTRRNLIATLQLCAVNGQSDPRQSLSQAITQIYIDRYPDAADRKAIQAHLRAADLT
ncbi:MAG: AAA family ATPase, partial [Hydrogenophaga sp.]